VDDAPTAGAFVQIIDVLSDEQKAVAERFFQPRQRPMRSVGLNGRIVQLSPSLVIKTQHHIGIAGEPFGRRHVFYTVVFPQPVRRAKSADARFGGNSGAGQNDDTRLFWREATHAFSSFILRP